MILSSIPTGNRERIDIVEDHAAGQQLLTQVWRQNVG